MRLRHTLVPLALLVAWAPTVASGQGLRDRLKQRAKDAVEKADSALGAKTEKTEKAEKPAAQPVQKDAPSPAASTTGEPGAAGASAATPPGQGAWLNYDFVPGDRVIFYEDFGGNEVGDFPRRLRLKEGNMEVVQVQGKPMLRSADGGWFTVKLPEVLPPRFTVEVVYHSSNGNNPLDIATTASTFQRSANFGCYTNKAWVAGNEVGPNSGNPFQEELPTGFVTCAFTVDNGRGIKAYVDEHRTANAPQDSVVRTDTLIVHVPGGGAENDPTLVASIRVAAGGRKLYDVLSEKGRVATQGILFDTGSDRLRGESTPTLAEIGGMLRDHPELKLAIEGHTDDVGQPAANRTLSERRAAAVKAYLVSRLGVDAARLTAAGYGDTKPVAPNTTPEGRQQNRRVELVRM